MSKLGGVSVAGLNTLLAIQGEQESCQAVGTGQVRQHGN